MDAPTGIWNDTGAMESFKAFLNVFLHLDKTLGSVLDQYGAFTYAILFVIIFCETGLVVTPFLPGDSLLFAAGAFAAGERLNILWLFPGLVFAAVLGDAVNYAIGKRVGPKVFDEQKIGRFHIKKAYLEKTQSFYAKYGKKTIILSRFLPIVRTFAPFVAGVGQMPYRSFFLYNVIGGVLWVTLFLFGGYFFGSIAWVQEHFSLAVLAIIVLSVILAAWEFFRAQSTSDV